MSIRESELTELPVELAGRAADIALVAFDVDGTLTDGLLHYHSDGSETKSFHVHDGHGLKSLARHGIRVALMTARHSPIVAARAAELGIEDVFQGVADKRHCLERLAARHGITLARCAYMGDDLPDLPAMSVVGLACAPADAHPRIAAAVHWRSRHAGGRGAARELCDLLVAIAERKATTIGDRSP